MRRVHFKGSILPWLIKVRSNESNVGQSTEKLLITGRMITLLIEDFEQSKRKMPVIGA